MHRINLHGILPDKHVSSQGPIIVYEPCTKISPAPKGTIWPEEMYIHDAEPSSILTLADPFQSKAWIEGRNITKVGDTVKVRIVLYDGYRQRKKTGEDLVCTCLIIVTLIRCLMVLVYCLS